MTAAVERRLVSVADVQLETFHAYSSAPGLTIAAAHPAEVLGADSAALLAQTAGTQVVCITPRGLGGSSPSDKVSLEQMVDDIEAVRLQLNAAPWVFWGMSGGGWLALLYAHRHPEGLARIIFESADLSLRRRLGDPECALSPYFPAWRTALEAAGLFDSRAHDHARELIDTSWVEVPGVGQVLRRNRGAALLCAPAPLTPEMQRAMPALWAFDARPWVATLRTPCLVLCGTADPIVPVARVRAVHEAIAGSTFLAIPNGGHVPSLQQPAAITEAIGNFLAPLR